MRQNAEKVAGRGIGEWGYGDKKKTKIKATHTQTTRVVHLSTFVDLYLCILFQELGFFGGKTVLKKQFGETIDDDDAKQSSGASAWKEKKVICGNPYCKVHGHQRQLQRTQSAHMSHINSHEGRYKSHVSNAYGVTDNLDIDDDVPKASKKSKVPSDDEAGASTTTSKVVLKPRRQPSREKR